MAGVHALGRLGSATILFAVIACASLLPVAGATGQAPQVPVPAPASDPAPALAPGPAPRFDTAPVLALSDLEMEQFLREAKVKRTKGTKKGVTGSVQATLSNGTITHDAHIQTIDEYKREFRSDRGVEFDFRDSWAFNIAGYKLDRLIGLNMVPVSVAGHYRSSPAAISWWIDDVLMDEGERIKKRVKGPDSRVWSQQLEMMRLFDQLIANTDRNLGNMVYTSDWRLWLIDHTRAFRKNTALKNPAQVTRCDRQVFERLKALDRDTLKREIGKFLDAGQIKSLLARRDAIVKKLESLGPSALFDRNTHTESE